jgi:glycosyltransferase involved in cell wall biosynthesis
VSEPGTRSNRPTDAAGMVSICITTYQGAYWVRGVIESALAQTYPNIEVLVVDDVSKDDTVDIVREFADPRIRLFVNPVNLGLARNWDRCTELARGEYIKFLDQDDMLHPECVARMVDLAQRSPRIGLVFSRRHVLADDPDGINARRFMRHHGNPDKRFGTLEAVNNGRELLKRASARHYRNNWVGEPSCVMVRKSAVEHVGGWNARMVQTFDWEMWLRLMFFFDVGFIPEPLATYRLHSGSMSAGNRAKRAYWMDLPWLVEGLREHPEIRSSYPELAWLGPYHALRGVIKQLRRVATGHRRAIAKPGSGILPYLRHRLSRRGSEDRLHAAIRRG